MRLRRSSNRCFTAIESSNPISFFRARRQDYWKLKSAVYYRVFLGRLGSRSWLIKPILIMFPKSIYIGSNCMIRDGARLECVVRPGAERPGEIRIGSNVTMEQGIHIVAGNLVEIGDGFTAAPRCIIVDTTHPIDGPVRGNRARQLDPKAAFVKIGRNVFLGSHVIVLPNVEIGDNTVVAAGSVVASSLPPNVVAVGQPAKVARQLRS